VSINKILIDSSIIGIGKNPSHLIGISRILNQLVFFKPIAVKIPHTNIWNLIEINQTISDCFKANFLLSSIRCDKEGIFTTFDIECIANPRIHHRIIIGWRRRIYRPIVVAHTIRPVTYSNIADPINRANSIIIGRRHINLVCPG